MPEYNKYLDELDETNLQVLNELIASDVDLVGDGNISDLPCHWQHISCVSYLKESKQKNNASGQPYLINYYAYRVSYLKLQSNQLTSLPASFGNLTQLRRLQLYDNQLTSLPESFGNLSQLKALSLHQNQLTSLPDSFGNLSQLKALSLHQNQLTSLPDSFGNLNQLRALKLHNNQLSSLPESFGNLTQLHTLKLYNNQLNNLPESFGNLTQLQHVILHRNQLTSLPESFGNLSQVQRLSLSENQLSSLPESLGNLSQLHTLKVNNNQLKSLPENFSQLSQLQYVDLHKNQLTDEIPSSLGNLDQLHTLNLSYNQFTGEIPASLGTLAQIRFLHLGGNQLTGEIPEFLWQLINNNDEHLPTNNYTIYFWHNPQLGGLLSDDLITKYPAITTYPKSLFSNTAICYPTTPIFVQFLSDSFQLLTQESQCNNDNRSETWLDNIDQPSNLNADEDEDGIEDSWEYQHFNSLTHDMSQDSDNDELSDYFEYLINTNPQTTDSDNDQISDGIEVAQGSDPLNSASTLPAISWYETGSGLNNWVIYDNKPSATISNVYDIEKQADVIEFTGVGTENGYHLYRNGIYNWNNDEQVILQWDMRFNDNYGVYVSLDTTDGHRYLYYTNTDQDRLTTSLGSIHYGLGTASTDDQWHTFSRNLADDLTAVEANNRIIKVRAFLIRGNGRLTNVQLRTHLNTDIDSDNDGLSNSDEAYYGTHPYQPDTDGDGLLDNDKLAYWGIDYQDDFDNDGIINLFDPDSDNDQVSDGIEVAQGSDPLNSASTIPAISWYETGTGLTNWVIYDNDPSAIISSVYDIDKQADVIEFTGAGTENGYHLHRSGIYNWNNNEQVILQWDLRFNDDYAVYVSLDTTDGHRYLYYTNTDQDRLTTSLGSIHYGLGTASTDDQWHTFSRNLADDLTAVEANNRIIKVRAFLIRGNGRLTNVQLRTHLNTDIDSDNDGLSNSDEAYYGTHPYQPDTDGDGLLDNDKLAYWGIDYQDDFDNDGIINLFDPDSDNDQVSDGIEVAQGSDPLNDASTLPAITWYETGTGIDNWFIYDNDPSAIISSVYDTDKQADVIEFTGAGIDNGYHLYRSGIYNWNNDEQVTLQWDMRFNDNYGIYISLNTTNGHRYLYYTNTDHDMLTTSPGSIHFGLGADSADDQWHTFNRNLADDLTAIEPNNNIVMVRAFLIRGNGRLTNVQLRTNSE